MQPFWRGAWYLLRQTFHFPVHRCLAMAGPYGVLDSALPAQPLLQPYKQVRLLRALIPVDNSLQAVGAANSAGGGVTGLCLERVPLGSVTQSVWP